MKKKRMNGLILAAAAFMLLFMYGCSMSSSGNPGDEDEIPLAAGQFTMNTSGGDGSDGYGGNGNGLQIVIGGPGYGGSGGDIKVLDTGVADAGFSFPSSVTTYLGDNPLTVTADTIVAVEAAEPAAGTPYMVNEEYRLFISDGDAVLGNAEEEVTGVSVAAGVTLTLGLNFYSNTQAGLSIESDFHNAGTVTTAKLADGISNGALEIYAAVYHGETGSSITLAGASDPVGTVGGFGGSLSLYCDFLYNQGDINTSGASDDNGGDAGYIEIYASYTSYNTGNITAKGGEGTSGNGGEGISIYVSALFGHNYNSGALDGSGGNGTVSGGNPNSIAIATGPGIMMGPDSSDPVSAAADPGPMEGFGGDLLNSGDLTANGGTGVEGQGGLGGVISLMGYSGAIINSGNLNAAGGSSTAAAGGSNYGGVMIMAGGFGSHSYDVSTEGNIEVSGNIDVSGGSGTIGGRSGGVGIYLAPESPAGQEIILYGYTDINTSGGDGSTDGGNGGGAGFYNEYTYTYLYGGIYGPSGGILNKANIDTSGGNNTGDTGSGGNGGSVYLYTEEEGYGGSFDLGMETVVNQGDITTSGGSGPDNGGSGGGIQLFGAEGSENSGTIIANGGAATDVAGGSGGQGNRVGISSDAGSAVNKGDITVNGGSGPYSGGYSSGFGLMGAEGAENSGTIMANGGEATDAEGWNGGTSSGVDIYSYTGAAVNQGDITANGGSGGYGGNSSGFDLYGAQSAENSGTVIVNGGAAIGDVEEGGYTSGVYITSENGPAVNAGALTAEGGDALGTEASAGSGGEINIVGISASNGGNIAVPGGDANITDGYGGDGGYVLIQGLSEGTVNTATSIDVSPGAGFEPGDHGMVFIGGFNVTGTWYTP